MNSEIVIHQHLGLGDHFIVNGIVNVLSMRGNIGKKSLDKIYLGCKKQNYETVNFMYCENKKVEVFVIEADNVDDEKKYVKEFADKKKIKLLTIGHENHTSIDWYVSFYDQLKLSYYHRYLNFILPLSKPDNLLDVPTNKFILLHDEVSDSTINSKVKINSDLEVIKVKKQKGNNMFSYLNLILNATEIHVVPSSFFCFVDSIFNRTNGKLFFHDCRKNPSPVKPNNEYNGKVWNIVNYD